MTVRNLKRYQVEARSAVMAALRSSGSVVLQMPTGSGKTVIATDIVSKARGTVLFICHRKEIIRQASRHFSDAGIRHGVVAPGFPSSRDRVRIASVQTLARRDGDGFDPKLVIWDECHHVAAKSWRKVMDAYPDAKHIGLTATPERLDGKGLGDCFSRLVCGPTTATLIKRRQLSRYRYFAPSDPDLTAAKMQAGDYRRSDIAKIMNTPVLVGDALAEYQKHASGKRAICFAVSVEASKSLASRFNQAGIPAAHVDATTPEAERDAAVAGLEAGSIKVLSNVEVFTEGFDLPAIDAVILMRPTKSTQLYLQMVGRGLRTAKGKDAAIIFDHAGLWLDHELPDVDREWSLDGGARQGLLASRRKHGQPMRRCPECSVVHRMVPRCPECGFEYPTGREIGEYDAQLRELRSVVPEGCATVMEFSRLTRINHNSIYNWVRGEGMPNIDGYPDVSRALIWIESRKKREIIAKLHHPKGCEGAVSAAVFSREIGISTGTISKLISKGMPAAPNGWPLREDAIEWLGKNYKSRIHRPFDVKDPENYISPKTFEADNNLCSGMTYILRSRGLPCASNGWVHAKKGRMWLSENLVARSATPVELVKSFARRFGVSTATVRAWKKAGLPHHLGSGKIYTGLGDAWVKENRPSVGIAPDDDEYLTRAAFARLLGVDTSTIGGWVGIPRGPRGTVPKNKALAWVKERRFPIFPPMDVDHPDDYEQRGRFSKRIGISDGLPSYWAKRGLPCASNGWVHIQRGLEWVRDNTNIKIPDSAWPEQPSRREAA